MITKTDLLLLLSDMEDGKEYINKVLSSPDIPMDVVKYINNKRELDVSAFYTHIRKSYNQKKSKLYIQIMKGTEDINEAVTTLASLQLQLLLFSKKVNDKSLFLKNARAQEICNVLMRYYQNFDGINCFKLLRYVKADIIAFEVLNEHREK